MISRLKLVLLTSIFLSPLSLISPATQAQPATYDLTTHAGLVAALDDTRLRNAANLRSQDDRVMSVVVRDVALVREKISWAFSEFKSVSKGTESGSLEQLVKRVRVQLEDVIAQMAQTRRVLESIHLKNARSVRIRPSEWALDLDGDGEIAPWEEKFFALPARHAQTGVSNPFDTSRETYLVNTSDAVIQVDQADVLWMLAYHNFIEGALELLLSYEIKFERGFVVELTDTRRPAAKAVPRIEAGLRASRASMQAALAESHDREEWLPNPRQRNTTFPLAMDAAAFGTWQQVVDSMVPLMQSKTLLAVPEGVPIQGPITLCPQGTGMDVGAFWRNPPKELGNREAIFLPYCKKPSAAQPVSPLTALLSQRIAQAGRNGMGGEMTMLRYLYWIN